MNIAFTLCSINYLAQAKTLYDSFHKHNPDWRFIIGLVDKNVNNADLSFVDCEVLEVENIAINDFSEMVKKYTIVELLTSVKPFYFSWLFNHNPQADKIIYFDPDIIVFKPIIMLEESLNEYDIILTPHYTTPITDNFLPTELHVMRTGIYNLGFIALKKSTNTFNMLRWWEEKLKNQCIIDLSRGLFVDQLWANLMPAYFEKVLIEKYPGYNMAHWNIHERTLEKEGNDYFVNGKPLVFFHFSHYSPANPDAIAAYHTRYNFKSRPDLKEIFKQYHDSLLQYDFFTLKNQQCYYMNNEKKKKRKREIENFLRTALPISFKQKIKKVFG